MKLCSVQVQSLPNDEQVEWACQLVRADPLLAGGYTGIGYSQGGLLLRGLAQLCPEPPMLQLVTIGSPHQGIAGLPRCPGHTPHMSHPPNTFSLSGSASVLCPWMRRILSAGAYLPWVQGLLVIFLGPLTLIPIIRHACSSTILARPL